MRQAVERLSVPSTRTKLPRALSEDERTTYAALADLLCGPSARVEPPSRCPEFQAQLDIALATRSDAFDIITRQLAEAAGSTDLSGWLRALHDDDPAAFQLVSTVAAGAYLMVPGIREAVGYPGQHRNPPGLEEAVDEISDGILDPVLDRGHFYVVPPRDA
jgi:hypothetical protein